METQKFYGLGLVCGRFSHEHLGHISLFDTAKVLCKSTLILVGSAQEYGTLRNPFKLETRIDVIKQTYPNESEETLMIRGINDLTNEYNVSTNWGKYVKSEVEHHKHKFANLMVYGNDEFRSKWFAPEDLTETAELIIPRSSNPISGTLVRGFLVINDKSNWQKTTSPHIHGMYERLRDEIMNVPIYKQIYDNIYPTDLSIDNFMNIYKKLEEEDKKNKLAKIKKQEK